MSIVVIYGGSRQNGNTEILTETMVQGVEVEKVYLRDYEIQPIEDLRHTREGFREVEDDYNTIIDRVLQHDILVFSTPIYWFGMTGTLKNFIDRWSQSIRDKPYFKEKMATKQAYVIAVGGDMPSIKGIPLIQQFHYIFDFIGIEFKDYVLGLGNKPGEISQDKKALFSANLLLEKMKE